MALLLKGVMQMKFPSLCKPPSMDDQTAPFNIHFDLCQVWRSPQEHCVLFDLGTSERCPKHIRAKALLHMRRPCWFNSMPCSMALQKGFYQQLPFTWGNSHPILSLRQGQRWEAEVRRTLKQHNHWNGYPDFNGTSVCHHQQCTTHIGFPALSLIELLSSLKQKKYIELSKLGMTPWGVIMVAVPSSSSFSSHRLRS